MGMSFELQMEQMHGYLVAKFIGSGAPGEASAQFESIAKDCVRTKNNKLLIDGTRYDVNPSPFDRFLMGERLQVFARHRIKVAFFSRPDQLDRQKLGVLVAQNRGVNVDRFTDLQAAEEWLLK